MKLQNPILKFVNNQGETVTIDVKNVSVEYGIWSPTDISQSQETNLLVNNNSIYSCQCNFERGQNEEFDSLKLGEVKEMIFSDGTITHDVKCVIRDKKNTKNATGEWNTFLKFTPIVDEVDHISVNGGSTINKYLKTIEKNTTEGKIKIKDQDGNETEFPYGGSGGSVSFEDITGQPRDNDNLNVELTNYDTKIAQLETTTELQEEQIIDVDDKIDGHAEDTTIHVTSQEKSTWNSKADQSDLEEEIDQRTEDVLDLNTGLQKEVDDRTAADLLKQDKSTLDTDVHAVGYNKVIANPTGTATDTLNKLSVNGTIFSIEGGSGGDVYWSNLPFSSSDETTIIQYLEAGYVDNSTDQTIAGFKTFTDPDGIKVADSDGSNYVRYGAGTIHYKRLDVPDEFDYLLPTESGTIALQSDITKVQANPTSEATATLNKLKVGDTTYSISGGGGDATVYLVDAELNYQTGEITWHSETISEDVLAYYDEHGYFPTIKLHLVVKYQGQIVQETNCDSKDNMKVESEDGDYLISRFIIDGIKESSSEGDKLEIQQFIYEDYGAEGKIGEVVEFSTESFQASKYLDRRSIEGLLEEKQDILTAGDNITIVDNVISAQIGERAPTFVITAEYDEETEEWVITSDNYYSQIITFFNTNNYYPSVFLRIGQNDYILKDITKNEDESLRLATDTSDPSNLYLNSNKYIITLANEVQRMEHWSKLISDYAIKAEFTDQDEVSVTQINNGTQEVVKTPRLQKRLTAGDNISIVEDVISSDNQLKNMYIHYVFLEEDTEEMYANSSPELFIITDDPTPYTSIYRFFEDISASNKVSYRGPLHLKYTNPYGATELGFAHVLFTMLEESEPGVGALIFDYQVGATPDDGIVKATDVRRITFTEHNAIIRDTVVPLFPNIFYCDYQFEHCSTTQSKWYIPDQRKFVLVTPDEGYKLPEEITHSDNLTFCVLDGRGYLSFTGVSGNSWIKITAVPENKKRR